MSTPVSKEKYPSFKALLFLLSKVYGKIVKTRLRNHRTGRLKSKRLPCFVISVGNITVGGTGKTPMTVYVAELVRQMGYKVAVLSRGYKGTFEASGGVVCNGHSVCCTPKESGDEPYMMAQTLGVPLLAGKKRYALGIKAIEQFNAQVIILDDAFQHIQLKRDLDIVLLDAQNPFGNGALLPRGPLREPVSSLERCDTVIFTRSDVKGCEPSRYHKWLGEKPVLKTRHCPGIFKILSASGHELDKKTTDNFLMENRKKRALLFSGIANNSDFKKTCETMGMTIAGHLEFPDHYWYKAEDMALVLNQYKKLKADFIVTTQKDYVKIDNEFVIPKDLVVVGVSIKFMKNHDKNFKSLIKERIKSKDIGVP